MSLNQIANPEADSAGRTVPPCPHFGPCGGCQLQNLTYSAQLQQKAARLQTLLSNTALPLPEVQLHPSPPLAYRNRIRLTLAGVAGQLRAGYMSQLTTDNRQLTTSFLPITKCPIAAPILWRATEAFLTLFNLQPATRNLQLTPDQLELFTTADESKIQLSLYLRTALKNPPAKLTTAFTALCESLRNRIPELTGAGVFLLPPHSADRSRRTEIPRPGPTWGAPGLTYTVESPQLATSTQQLATAFWVPRGAFFQINRFLLPELLALAVANRTGTLAWDLYAGVGLFSRALAMQFTQVTAVEIAEPAVTALAATKLTNLRAIKATTLDFLRASVVERDRPDLIVLDPPRTGAGRDVCELLGRVAAPTLVYVSCSPETLPADLVTLTAAGYTVTELHLFDLFPQTTHIETVAILTRIPEEPAR